MNATAAAAATPLFAPTTFFPSSPAPSASSDEHEAGPSRKRARTEMTTEQRKEARAHRNRIAAQNSRDKRKAEFGALHERVAALEAENARLRAGAAVVVAPLAPPQDPTPWEAENAALKERIRTLEKGWDVILKALAAQGLPTGLLAPEGVQPSVVATATAPQPQQPQPVMVVPASPVFPPTPSSLSPAFTLPSPAPAVPELPESARHPAAGGLFDSVPALAGGGAYAGAAGAPAPAAGAGMDGLLASLSAGADADWAAWDAPADAAAEMRALLEMWPSPAPAAERLDDLALDLGSYLDTAALGLDLGVAPPSIGAF